jgi:hypothetical protein
MVAFFQRRKSSFLESLGHILESITTDLFVRQMFEDPSSAIFIPDRICELIERYLRDDHERQIDDLSSSIAAIKACLGEDRTAEVIDAGLHILELLSHQDPVSQHQISELRQQAASPFGRYDFTILRQTIESFRANLGSVRRFVERCVKLIRASTNAARQENESVGQKLQEHSIIEAQLREELSNAQNRFSKVDMPRFRKRYEEQLAEQSRRESELNRELDQSKMELLSLSREHQRALDDAAALKHKLTESQSMAHETAVLWRQKGELEEAIQANRTAKSRMI